MYELNTKARRAHLGLCQQQNLMIAANSSYSERNRLSIFCRALILTVT